MLPTKANRKERIPGEIGISFSGVAIVHGLAAHHDLSLINAQYILLDHSTVHSLINTSKCEVKENMSDIDR